MILLLLLIGWAVRWWRGRPRVEDIEFHLEPGIEDLKPPPPSALPRE